MRKLAGAVCLLFFSLSIPSYAYLDNPQARFYAIDIPDELPAPKAYNHWYIPYFLIDMPRLYLWGLAGSETIGRIDGLVPIVRRQDAMFYSDLQGKVGGDNAWLASGGLGYRGLRANHIFGGYLFLDRNVSEHHNVFYVLSPGVEVIHNDWEARLNGYIPVSEKRKRGPSFFPSGDNSCGIASDCRFVEFQGHQQFEHRFFHFEEVGPGFDVELGLNFGRSNNLSIHAGGYYFQFEDKDNIRGVEARIEMPIQNNIALTLEGCYDNKERGAVVGGVRIQLGHTQRPRAITIDDHFYDRVARNLGTVYTGSGIPTQEGNKDEGLFLRRDNIFFFTANGGALFTGLDSGTFENPLRADQFNSANLLAIKNLTGNGNFYFNTGTYSLGATTVTVLQGQSLFGRSPDYRCTAIDDERPVLAFDQIGSPALIITGGNNIMDSIILQNISDGPSGLVIALDVENNSGLFICNSVIDAETHTLAPGGVNNVAIGILANNSAVTIDPTLIKAEASTAAPLVGIVQAAIGIGTDRGTFNNNRFILNNVTIQANAISSTDAFENASLGIGAFLNGTFDNNNFLLNRCFVTANSNVNNENNSVNLSVGIGGLDSEDFSNNNFNIANAAIRANAVVSGSNSTNAENFVIGVGDTGSESFTNNVFAITDSSVFANALVGQFNANVGRNVAVGVGDLFSTIVTGNSFLVNESEIIAIANIGRDNVDNSSNRAIGIGAFGTLSFNNNNFSITKSFTRAQASVQGNNDITSDNLAFGVESNTAGALAFNVYNIDRSAFLVQALIGGNNNGDNIATALFAETETTINVSNSFFDVFALVQGPIKGNNQAIQTAGGGTFNIFNTHFNLVQN